MINKKKKEKKKRKGEDYKKKAAEREKERKTKRTKTKKVNVSSCVSARQGIAFKPSRESTCVGRRGGVARVPPCNKHQMHERGPDSSVSRAMVARWIGTAGMRWRENERKREKE